MDYDDPRPILQLGSMEIDMRRHSYISADFSNYFPPYDCHEREYSWRIERDGEVFTEPGKRCRTPLWVVVERLNLLGWNQAVARRLYDEGRALSEGSARMFPQVRLPPYPSFDAIAEGIAAIDIQQVPEGYAKRREGGPWHDAATRAVRADGRESKTNFVPDLVKWYRRRIEELDTSTIIHMLSQNRANRDIPVTWWAYNEVIYGLLDENGYADQIGAKARDRVMIVTEGKSDTSVIAQALATFRPHIQDFFTFVDMSDNYPFTGVGNLSNFHKGLHKIGVLNNVIVLFDNDAEGATKFKDAESIHSTSNIRPMKLPDLPQLSHFHTIGPTGEDYADINGQAASIECFLDLDWLSSRRPSVRWTSYLKHANKYQGELIDKGEYVKQFLSLTSADVDSYDSSKIEMLLQQICTETEAMATERLERFPEVVSVWHDGGDGYPPRR